MLLAVDIGKVFKVGDDRGISDVFPDIGSLVSAILPNFYVVAGLLLFFLLIFGGFSLIMGAGGSNPQQAEKGKQAITAAVVGFLIVFLSYWIIQIIEIVTGINIFNSGL